MIDIPAILGALFIGLCFIIAIACAAGLALKISYIIFDACEPAIERFGEMFADILRPAINAIEWAIEKLRGAR